MSIATGIRAALRAVRPIRTVALLSLLLCLLPAAVHAGITLEGTSTAGVAPAVTAVTLGVPTQVVTEGDVMVVQLVVRTTGSVTAPGGWTLLRQDTSGTELAQWTYMRVAGAAEPASYTWTFPGARAAGTLALFRGVDTDSPLGAVDGNAGTGTTLTAPSVEVDVAGSQLLTLFSSANGNAVLGVPAGMGLVVGVEAGAGPNGNALMVAGELRAPGGTGERQTSSEDTAWAAHSLVLRPAASGPDHIRLLHDGEGLTCAPESVTVQACADETCSTLFMDPVDVTLGSSPGGAVWSPNPVTVTDGTATVSLRYTTPGVITLGVFASDPAAQALARCFNGALETCDMTFHESGFVFDFDDVQPILAGRTAAPVTVTALKSDPADPVSCAPAFTGPRVVGMWFDYSDPAAGTLALSVDGTALGTTAPGTPVILDFDAGGQASIQLLYPDAGRLNLHARYEGDDEEEGLVMTGSGQFLVRPAGLCVDAPGANSDCVPASTACSVFRRAGEHFELRVSAVAWRADDGGDLCVDRATRVTPNFRLAGIPLASELIAPLPGQPGALAVSSVDIGATDAGVATLFEQELSEVGVFRISAQPAPGAYQGVDVNGGLSANLGRFIPYDFQVLLENDPAFQAACNGRFTYLSQWFGYAMAPQVHIAARNRHGVITRNYDGDWWRLPDIVPGYVHAGDPEPLPESLVFTPDAGHDPIDCAAGGCEGEVTIGFSGEFTYERDGEPVDPVNGAVRVEFPVEDDDGVAFAANPFEFTVGFEDDRDEQRWGRLEMHNAHGPELLPLTVPMFTSYFLDGAFRVNAEDNCTVVDVAHVDLDIQLTGGSTTADVINNPASAGRLDVSLSAPGAGNTGYVDLTPDLSVATGADLPWLTFDWDADGTLRGPEARATFGVYEGSERHIYIRELP